MSDVMLHGMLCMPPELWTNDELDKMQRYDRYLQASRHIEELTEQRDELLAAVKELQFYAAGCMKDGVVSVKPQHAAEDFATAEKAITKAEKTSGLNGGQRVTIVKRLVTIEETYELPVDHPKTITNMLRKAEERGTPYVPTRTRVVRRGRWVVPSLKQEKP